MKFLHKYLRAIGFSKLKDRKELQKLITNIIIESNERSYTSYDGNDTILTEFCKDFAENIGIAVCGVFDSDNKFIYDYYFPYMKGSGISSEEDISVERHAGKESYAGICDDIKGCISNFLFTEYDSLCQSTERK